MSTTVKILLVLTGFLASRCSAEAQANFEQNVLDTCMSTAVAGSPSVACTKVCETAQQLKLLDGYSRVTRSWCVSAFRNKEIESMKTEKACGPETCIHRLTSITKGQYRGAGYLVTYRNYKHGCTLVVIKDPKGCISNYEFCGNGPVFGRVDGPLMNAQINDVKGGIILTVPHQGPS